VSKNQNKINPLKQEKIRKRQELLKKGIDPYPHCWNKKRIRSVSLTKQFLSLKAGEEAEGFFYVAGRLMRKRPMGKTAFFNIQDEEGMLQCYIRRDDFSNPTQNVKSESLSVWDLWKLCDIGDILGLSGLVFKSQKGEISLKIKDLQILCKSLELLPEKYHGLEDKELKYRYRHLDLIMNQESRKVFQLRSQIIYEIRNFMHKKGFMEVETPVLQPIYGGAVAQPFETFFRRLHQKMYLKISPEIYLKKLIVGGFEKVFEIGKNFRNEGIDRSHNPEFTMMEYYESYTDYEYQMKQFEELICYITQKIKGKLKFEYQKKNIDFTTPWERLTVKEAVKKYSSIDFDQMSYDEIFKYVQSCEFQIDLKKFKPDLKKSFSQKQLEDLKTELVLIIFEEKIEKNLWNPVFITDFPLAVSPLTKKHRKDSRLVERFEPYIAGMELGNAYTELNDPVDQRQRLENQKRYLSDTDSSQPLDENFLHALEVGMPPVGGVGLGIERLVMILTDQSNIKDSMFFPMLKDKV